MGHWSIISFFLVISMAILHSSHAHNEPEDFTDAHNCIRRVLGIEPLCWDEELAKTAQAWADQRKDCQLIHSDRGGENMAYGPDLNASYAVQLWIDERPNYDYAKNECIKMCGHYTQVVWRNSKRVGCGRAKCEPYDYPCYMIVCNYDPPGNVVGQWPY